MLILCSFDHELIYNSSILDTNKCRFKNIYLIKYVFKEKMKWLHLAEVTVENVHS